MEPLFPSAEVMDDATDLVLPVNPGGDILEIINGRVAITDNIEVGLWCVEIINGRFAITDNIEVGLWCGRVMDSRRVNGTLAGVMDNPVLVPEMTKARLS